MEQQINIENLGYLTNKADDYKKQIYGFANLV